MRVYAHMAVKLKHLKISFQFFVTVTMKNEMAAVEMGAFQHLLGRICKK